VIINKKRIIFTLFLSVLAVLLLLGFLVELKEKPSPALEFSGVKTAYVYPDAGLQVEYIDIYKAVFLRYRFYDAEMEELIDMSSENARFFVTGPEGNRTEFFGEERFFYPVRIYPEAESGIFKFEIKASEDLVYEAELDFQQPRETLLIPKNQERISQEGVKLLGYGLLGMKLSKVESAFRIAQNNEIFSIIDDIDQYFWIPEDVLNIGEHLFLFKQDNVWYYYYKENLLNSDLSDTE